MMKNHQHQNECKPPTQDAAISMEDVLRQIQCTPVKLRSEPEERGEFNAQEAVGSHQYQPEELYT